MATLLASSDAPVELPPGTVVLKTANGELHTTRDVLKMSKLIGEMLEANQGDGDDVIPLPNVDKATMEKVLAWLAHHLTNPVPEIARPIKSPEVKVILKDYAWDAEYIDSDDQEMIFNLVLAANYLDIEPLLDLGCMRIAAWLKNRTPQEIRQFFNIAEPTAEEEEQIRKENAWIFEVRPADAPPAANP